MNGDEPAYPCEQGETQEGTWNQTFSPGLTKRETFAMAAMQGLLAKRGVPLNIEDPYELMAGDAVKCADALLDALKEPK